MSIDFAVLQRGSTVRVTLAPSTNAAADQENDIVVGTLFLIDEQTQTLVIETFSNTSRKRGYNMIALSAISDVAVLQDVSDAAVLELLPASDQRTVDMREAKSIDKRTEEALKIGRGVSSEAQTIFDSLAKTMPCAWQGDSILVMESVLIASPYTADQCTGSNAQQLERVQKILEAERKKLKL